MRPSRTGSAAPAADAAAAAASPWDSTGGDAALADSARLPGTGRVEQHLQQQQQQRIGSAALVHPLRIGSAQALAESSAPSAPLSPLSSVLLQASRQQQHNSSGQRGRHSARPSADLDAFDRSPNGADANATAYMAEELTDRTDMDATASAAIGLNDSSARSAPLDSFSLPAAASAAPPADGAGAALSTGDTPPDILQFYASYQVARSQLVLQSLAAVRLVQRSWSKLCLLSRDAQERQKRAKSSDGKAGPPMGGARHSMLAASYMSMVQQQQEQQQAAQERIAQQQAAAHAAGELDDNDLGDEERIDEEAEDEEAADEPESGTVSSRPSRQNSASKAGLAARKSTAGAPQPRSSDAGHSSGRPSTTTLGAHDMERAVQNAHQSKLAKEALENAERKRAEEDARAQAAIRAEQNALRERVAAGEVGLGESPWARLQAANKDVSAEPLRVGIIGAGRIGAAVAEQILQQFCGMRSASRTSALGLPRTRAPTAQPGAGAVTNQVRVFISTRRPEHPQMLSLLQRANGSAASAGVSGTEDGLDPSRASGGGAAGGPVLSVYFDNARLVTECNVVLVCVLPHQLQSIASTLRSLSPANAPATQLFFALSSAHGMKALRTHFGPEAALAQPALVLPHLLSRGGPEAMALLARFKADLQSGLTQALRKQACFDACLGGEVVARVVKGHVREMEDEVAQACFMPTDVEKFSARHATVSFGEAEPSASPPRKQSVHRGSLAGSNVVRGLPSAAGAAPYRTTVAMTPATVSMASFRPDGVGSAGHFRAGGPRATATSVGLTPPAFVATAAPMPSMSELRAREAKLQAAREAHAATGVSAAAQVAAASATGQSLRGSPSSSHASLPALHKPPATAATSSQHVDVPLRNAFSRGQIFRAQPL